MDIVSRGYLTPDHLKLMVLDEADEMLGIGFKESINEIFKYLPTDI